MVIKRSGLRISLAVFILGLSLFSHAQITIESGAELTIMEGETLTVEGNIDNMGIITGKGTINVGGNYSNTGTFAIRIGPDQSTHTTLSVTGTFTAGGIFTVTNDSYTPMNGDQATIITAGTSLGSSFSNTDNNDWIANYNLPNSGDYSISYSTILPIELIDFSGKNVEGIVILEWETASEVNNKGFEIQRSSDANTWLNIGFVKGIGNSGEYQEYEFIDEFPLPGINYYRLKQIDLDERFEYSPLISLLNSYDQKVFISPNPNNGAFVVNGFNNGYFKILDTNGNLIVDGNLINAAIDISNVPSGIYLIQLISGNKILSQNFIIL